MALASPADLFKEQILEIPTLNLLNKTCISPSPAGDSQSHSIPDAGLVAVLWRSARVTIITRKPSHPKSYLLPRSQHPMTAKWRQRRPGRLASGQDISARLSQLLVPSGLCWGLCWITAGFSSSFHPVLLSSLPHRCWSQANSPINFLHATLCLRAESVPLDLKLSWT